MSRAILWNERGFTLAEILVAMVIISIGLVGIAVVVPVASYGVQEGNQLSTATFLAEQRIEQARNKVWTASPTTDCLGVGTPPAIAAGFTCPAPAAAAGAVTFPNETPVAGFTGYNRTTSITDCSTTTCAELVNAAGLRQITVSVSYTQAISGGAQAVRTKTVTVEWLVAQR